jgi:hypothetical protein
VQTEFSVPLAEAGCKLSIFKTDNHTPQGYFPVSNRAKKYPSFGKWVANPVIPNHEDLFHAIDATTEWKRKPFIVFGTRYILFST